MLLSLSGLFAVYRVTSSAALISSRYLFAKLRHLEVDILLGLTFLGSVARTRQNKINTVQYAITIKGLLVVFAFLVQQVVKDRDLGLQRVLCKKPLSRGLETQKTTLKRFGASTLDYTREENQGTSATIWLGLAAAATSFNQDRQ